MRSYRYWGPMNVLGILVGILFVLATEVIICYYVPYIGSIWVWSHNNIPVVVRVAFEVFWGGLSGIVICLPILLLVAWLDK